MKMQATVLGTEKLVSRFEKAGPVFKQELRRAMTRAMIDLQQTVKFRKLSGQVLKNRTGTLRRSINYKVKETPAAVVGMVGTNVKYGRFHELGGTFTVAAHVRQQTQAWGRALLEPRMVNVRAHQVTFKQRSFLGSAFEERRSAIFAELQAGSQRALGKV